MENIKLCFCDMEKQDIAALRLLLSNSDCKTDFCESQKKVIDSDTRQMGIEEYLSLLISSGTIASVLAVLKIWLKNKRTKFIIQKGNKRIEIDTTQRVDINDVLERIESFLKK